MLERCTYETFLTYDVHGGATGLKSRWYSKEWKFGGFDFELHVLLVTL